MLKPKLVTADLARACRLFLHLAYPGGHSTIPVQKRAFLDLACPQEAEPLLVPPVCEALRSTEGCPRGYAIRLGSAVYPHLKLRAVYHEAGAAWIFSVDTHDATCRLSADHPDAAAWAEVQAANRRLKEQVERAWETEGLLTPNGLLRLDLEKASGSAGARKNDLQGRMSTR
jgi:hypothetical protein